MTPADLYAINFQNPEPRYYSRIPHILDHLTYEETDPKTGEKSVKRLSVYAKELYRIIKSIAGEQGAGACWMNRTKLAELCNMSSASITNAKKELQQAFHQLDGNPLIKIEERKRQGVSESNTNYKTIYHCITILDIWRWNAAFMATKDLKKNIPLSPHDSAPPPMSPHDSAPQGPMSPHDTNKNNKNHLFKEQQPAASADPVCSPVVFSDADVPVPSDDEKSKAFNWFTKIGCDVKSATFFVESFSAGQVIGNEGLFGLMIQWGCSAVRGVSRQHRPGIVLRDLVRGSRFRYFPNPVFFSWFPPRISGINRYEPAANR